MNAKNLAVAFREAKSPLVVTGAGISVASGITPFRGTDEAVWSKTVLEMGTHSKFLTNPVAQWEWYLERFIAHRDAKPNAAHHALVEIEQLKREKGQVLRIVTQNVDGLHFAAGSMDAIEIHGKARLVRCSRYGCANGAPLGALPFDMASFEGFRQAPCIDTIPTCPLCSALLRPHVLWFDEYYTEHLRYRFAEAQEWMLDADLLVFVGTSFAVHITELAIDAAMEMKIPMWSVDPHLQHHMCTWVQGPAEVVLPEVVTHMKGAV